MTKKGSQRIDSFDFFRSYGCLAVILLHVMTGWRDDPINGLGFYSASFVRIFFGNVIVPILVRTAVPFFFMISGTLFLNPNRKVDSAYIRQKIIKILVITAFFGYFMCILELVATSKTLHLQYFYIGFLNLIQEKSWGHLWYLYVTVGLYLVTPILRVWLSEANRMELKTSMAVTVILFSVIPSINDLFGIEITQFGIISPRGALMWYLVGYYLSLSYEEVMKKGWKFIRYFLFAGGGLTGFFGILGYKLKLSLDQPYHFWVVIYASSLFLLFLKNSWINKAAKSRFIQVLSAYSLTIYIIHPIFLNLLYKAFHIYPDSFPPVIGEMLIWLVVVVASIIGAMILKKIPILKNYI